MPSSFRFIHAADLHVDSPLKGLERYEGAPVEQLRRATRQALSRLVDLAINEEVDFVVIAGDVFDGDWRDYNTGLFFVAEMARLDREGIPVYTLAGNHDADSVLTKSLTYPENVHSFSSKVPQSFELPEIGVALHGRGFDLRHKQDNYAVNYPPARRGVFNIGVLHTSADGRPGHDNYAPCSVADMVGRGYDYWALGHIHKREVLSEEPFIVFPGNTQGRHIGETGAKGCTLVTFDGEGARLEERHLDSLRWARLELDCQQLETMPDLLDHFADQCRAIVNDADGKLVAARLEFSGATAVHGEIVRRREHCEAELRNLCVSSLGGLLWLEKVRFRTRAAVNEEAARRSSTLGPLLSYIDGVKTDEGELKALSEELSDLRVKLGPLNEAGLLGPEHLAGLLSDVREELLVRLIDTEKEAE